MGVQYAQRNTKIGRDFIQQLEDEQEGLCGICGSNNGGLFVDHCHATGFIRGLLCLRCNSGIGFFDDSRVRLLRSSRYLRRHERRLSRDDAVVLRDRRDEIQMREETEKRLRFSGHEMQLLEKARGSLSVEQWIRKVAINEAKSVLRQGQRCRPLRALTPKDVVLVNLSQLRNAANGREAAYYDRSSSQE